MAPKQSSDSAADEVRAALGSALQRFGPDYWREQDAAKTFPTAFFDTMGEAGYFGTFIPEAYGGLDAGARVASVLVEEINRAGGDAASVNAQMAICRTLVLHGTEEQKQRYLPGVASGDIRFLTVAATEPDSGANMNELASSARRDGDDWLINREQGAHLVCRAYALVDSSGARCRRAPRFSCSISMTSATKSRCIRSTSSPTA